jgi:hypothetical protein
MHACRGNRLWNRYTWSEIDMCVLTNGIYVSTTNTKLVAYIYIYISDMHYLAHHGWLLLVMSFVLPVTNRLEAISYFVVVVWNFTHTYTRWVPILGQVRPAKKLTSKSATQALLGCRTKNPTQARPAKSLTTKSAAHPRPDCRDKNATQTRSSFSHKDVRSAFHKNRLKLIARRFEICGHTMPFWVKLGQFDWARLSMLMYIPLYSMGTHRVGQICTQVIQYIFCIHW